MIMCSSLQKRQTSLMFASQNGHDEIVRILLKASAKVDLQTKVKYYHLFPWLYGDLCPDVMLYCGLRTILVDSLGGVYTCVGL